MQPQPNPLLPFYRSYDWRADHRWRARVYAIAGGLILVLAVLGPQWLPIQDQSMRIQSWMEAYFLGTTFLLAAFRLVTGYDRTGYKPIVFHMTMLFLLQLPLFCVLCIMGTFLADGFAMLPDQL